MVHAKIVETRRGPPKQEFAPCAKQLCSADRNYYRQRANEEAEAARSASCTESRLSHEGLAQAYRLLCSANDKGSDAHLASELAMFQFNPKAAD